MIINFPSKAVRAVAVTLCCGGLLGSLPAAATAAVKAKAPSAKKLQPKARKN